MNNYNRIQKQSFFGILIAFLYIKYLRYESGKFRKYITTIGRQFNAKFKKLKINSTK
jgi:hypothetical protein